MPLGSTVQGCVCYLKGYYIVAFLFLCKGEAHGLLNKEGDAHKPLTRNPKESVYLHSRLLDLYSVVFLSMHLAILFKTAFQHIPS